MAAKKSALLSSIKNPNNKQTLKKVPEDEIHYVAPFDSAADLIEYTKKDGKYGDLFIGPKSSTHKVNHDFLKNCQIKCIISLSNAPIDEEFKLNDLIDYHYFEAKDENGFEIFKLFNTIHKIMDDNILNGKNVLVHCNMGVSRSGTIVVSFLMKTLGLSCIDALELAKKSRRCIQPNQGFMIQLKAFEAQCLQDSNKNNDNQDVDDNKEK